MKKQAKKKLPVAKPAKKQIDREKVHKVPVQELLDGSHLDDRRAVEKEAEAHDTKVAEEAGVKPTFKLVVLPSYEEHVWSASSFADQATKAFEKSEATKDNAEKVSQWQRCKVLTQISLSHAMAAQVIAGKHGL